MKSDRVSSVLVGILYILGTIFGVLSAIFTGSISSEVVNFSDVHNNQCQIKLGAMFVLMMGVSLAFIPILLFPIFKRYSEVLAVSYVVFRGALETITYLVTAISFILIANFSQYISGGIASDTNQSIGVLLSAIPHLPSTVFVFSIGAFIL